MSQANVFTSLSANSTWYTDKCEFVTGNTAITYQVYVTSLGGVTAVGNMYSASPSVAANSRQQIYVGAGNNLTIVGSNWTAREIGTQSSAQYGVMQPAGNVYIV
jgi:hypothetical protein